MTYQLSFITMYPSEQTNNIEPTYCKLLDGWDPLLVYAVTCHNPSFSQKHPSVPDSSDGCNGTLSSLTENFTLSVTHATGCIAYLPPVLYSSNAVAYMHPQNNRCLTLFPGTAVML
jgi:hypothetical protein